MGNFVLPTIAELRTNRDWFGFDDDFLEYVTADLWTGILTATGTVTVGDAAGGVAALTPSDGTVVENDQVYLKTTHELFLIAANKPIVAEIKQQYTPDAALLTVVFGLMNAVAADAIADTTGLLKADFSGACFYASRGDTTWRVIYSDGTTQTIVELDADGSLDGVAKTAASAAPGQILRIEIVPVTSALVDVMFYIADKLVCKMKDKTIASATHMNAFAGMKNGEATVVETVNIDRFACYQKR